MLADKISLREALERVEQAQSTIAELDLRLLGSRDTNFRERLVASLESSSKIDPHTGEKARALLRYHEECFGVNDLIDNPDAT